jgi:hypothetical protein
MDPEHQFYATIACYVLSSGTIILNASLYRTDVFAGLGTAAMTLGGVLLLVVALIQFFASDPENYDGNIYAFVGLVVGAVLSIASAVLQLTG